MGIQKYLPDRGVKSIQRGVVDFYNANLVTQTISTVVPSKCELSVYGNGRLERGFTGNVITTRTYSINLTAVNQITVRSPNFGIDAFTGVIEGTVTWQVVEYY